MNISTCPICGTADLTILFSAPEYLFAGKEYEHSICAQCRHVFVDPIPSTGELQSFYIKAAPKLNELFPPPANFSKDDLIGIPSEMEKVKFLETEGILEKRGKVLDIGFGKGGFLLSMKEKGWDCTGIEFTDEVSLPPFTAGEFEALFGQRGFDQLDKNSYDLITLWHVLEHLASPVDILKTARDFLKPDGHIVIAVPNFDGLSSKIFKEKWMGAIPPWHLHHFTPRTLSLAFAKSGLIVEKIAGFGKMEEYLLWVDSFTRTIDEAPNGPMSLPKKLFLKIARRLTSVSMPLVLRAEQRLGKPSAIIAVGKKNPLIPDDSR